MPPDRPLFASHAAIAVADAQDTDHITTALASRDVIGQATGILVERHRATADMTSGLLAETSPETIHEFAEVAGQLTETGVLGNRGQSTTVPPVRRPYRGASRASRIGTRLGLPMSQRASFKAWDKALCSQSGHRAVPPR
ncbi:ANTAR domain-containing protein [Geodermatophilus sp. SYSU D00079]